MDKKLFKLIIGPLNPKQPNQFFNVLIPFLRFLGMWAPESVSNWVQNVYTFYSILFRIFFLYIYAFCQAMYIKDITDIKKSSDVFFILLTLICLMYKLQIFYKNRHRIKACVRELNNPENIPQNEEEDEIIQKTALFELKLLLFYTFPLLFAFVPLAFLPLEPGFQLANPSWYPFEVAKYPNYYFLFWYNYFGVLLSAVFNTCTDYTVTALFLSAKAQIDRLGSSIEKENLYCPNSAVKLKAYIMRQKQLLSSTSEIEDIFSSAVFIQFIFTSFIVCVALFKIAEREVYNDEVIPDIAYLTCMILQLFLYCWSGNEVTLAFDSLTDKICSLNFMSYEEETSKMLIVFVEGTLQPKMLTAKMMFEIPLNLETLKKILESGYSYFTILRTLNEKVLGPINPKQPNQFFYFLRFILRIVGLWPPDSNEKWIQNVYTIYSIVYRILFLFTYVLTQIIYFKELSHFTEARVILFMLLTQISLIYKLDILFRNRYRIKACMKALNNEENIPKNHEEDKIIRKTSIAQMNFFLFYAIPSLIAFIPWALLPFQSGFQLPIPAWYPFEVNKYPNYYFAFAYNYFGMMSSATYNTFNDVTVTAFFLSAKAQVDRLGVTIRNIGNESNSRLNRIRSEETESSQSVVFEMKACILRHKQLLEFIAELEDIFSSTLFCQFMCSTFILCMTLLVIAESESFTEVIPLMGYLVCMVIQIFLYCWSGNEVSLALDSLSQNMFSSNFMEFDRKTSKMMLFFMQRTLQSSKLTAGKVFRVTLSLSTFMDILKSAYSYYTLLRSMHH